MSRNFKKLLSPVGNARYAYLEKPSDKFTPTYKTNLIIPADRHHPEDLAKVSLGDERPALLEAAGIEQGVLRIRGSEAWLQSKKVEPKL